MASTVDYCPDTTQTVARTVACGSGVMSSIFRVSWVALEVGSVGAALDPCHPSLKCVPGIVVGINGGSCVFDYITFYTNHNLNGCGIIVCSLYKWETERNDIVYKLLGDVIL